MNLLERIDALLEIDVVRRELGLNYDNDVSFVLAIPPFEMVSEVSTLSSTCPSCSLVYCKVREAKGWNCDPMDLMNSTCQLPVASSWLYASGFRQVLSCVIGRSYVRLFWKPLKASIFAVGTVYEGVISLAQVRCCDVRGKGGSCCAAHCCAVVSIKVQGGASFHASFHVPQRHSWRTAA